MSSEDAHDAQAAQEVRTPSMRIEPAVRSAFEALKPPARDQGAQALAIRYARLLDEAAPERGYAKAIRLVSSAVDAYADGLPITAEREVRDAWEKITTALSEHSTASDLGPKLLAALTALGATLAGRKEQEVKGAEIRDLPRPLAIAREQPAPWAPHRAG